MSAIQAVKIGFATGTQREPHCGVCEQEVFHIVLKVVSDSIR